MRHSILVALSLAVPVALGCAAKKETLPEAAAPAPTRAADLSAPLPTEEGLRTGGLRISEEIVLACHLSVAPPPPTFAFDSAALADQDRTLLAEIAKCFSEGPLRGHSVALVGRADPRGEDEYNMVLGESRADTVQRFLHQMGVAPQRVHATSRGELDAVGLDEDGWAMDRRVDIELASR